MAGATCASQGVFFLNARPSLPPPSAGDDGGDAVSSETATSTEATESKKHDFRPFSFAAPVFCDLCRGLIWGAKRHALKCDFCGFNCHKECEGDCRPSCGTVGAVRLHYRYTEEYILPLPIYGRLLEVRRRLSTAMARDELSGKRLGSFQKKHDMGPKLFSCSRGDSPCVPVKKGWACNSPTEVSFFCGSSLWRRSWRWWWRTDAPQTTATKRRRRWFASPTTRRAPSPFSAASSVRTSAVPRVAGPHAGWRAPLIVCVLCTPRVAVEVQACVDHNTLFRANSLASKALDYYMKHVGMDYLSSMRRSASRPCPAAFFQC